MSKISRRRFFEGTGAGLVATAVPLKGQQGRPAPPASSVPQTAIQFTINGERRKFRRTPCSIMGICSATMLPSTFPEQPARWSLRRPSIFLEP